MSADIKINFSDICPYLKEKGIKLDPILVDPEVETGSAEVCDIGENVVMAEIESDLMLNSETVKVEVSCEDCRFVPKGFTKIVDSRIE